RQSPTSPSSHRVRRALAPDSRSPAPPHLPLQSRVYHRRRIGSKTLLPRSPPPAWAGLSSHEQSAASDPAIPAMELVAALAPTRQVPRRRRRLQSHASLMASAHSVF